MRNLIIMLFLLVSIRTVAAQELQCPAIQRQAITQMQTACSDLILGEACYGAPSVDVQFVEQGRPFSSPGDRVAAGDLLSLQGEATDTSYGLSHILAGAYRIDSWETVPLSVLLLGDVALFNDGLENVEIGPTLTYAIETAQGINIRRQPDADATVIATLGEGGFLKLTGRQSDSSWVRVQLPDERVGWVASSVIQADLSALEDVSLEPDTPLPLIRPYAAFSLTTGTRDAACEEAWESGVLLQTGGDDFALIEINRAELQLNGTVFVQSPQNAPLTVYVLDGQLRVGEELVEAGSQAVIEAATVLVQPYVFERVQHLPMEALPEFVYIGLDLSRIITPAPQIDRSPIIDTLVTDPCVITTGQTGSNLRAGPGREFQIRGVLAFRETANPTGRATASDGSNWWQLAQNIWVSGATTVTGGDCIAVPTVNRIPVPLPTETPGS